MMLVKHIRIRKRKYWDVIGCLALRNKMQERNECKSYWMFFDANIDHVEILTPTLETLEDMKSYGLVYAVKGFLSRREFKTLDDLRYHYGIASYNFSVKCLGNCLFLKAFESMMTNHPLPSDTEVANEIERHRLQMVETDEDVKRLKERSIWFEKMNTYKSKLYRRILHMIDECRVYDLRTLQPLCIEETASNMPDGFFVS